MTITASTLRGAKALVSCGLALLLLSHCSSEDDPAAEPRCTMDTECEAAEICEASGACVIEEALCETSATCLRDKKFCVPRSEDVGVKSICRSVVRCDEVAVSDVSALCRLNNKLTGNEQFTCDQSLGAPTCKAKSSDTQPCSKRSDCTGQGEFCLFNAGEDGKNTCGVPRSCDAITQGERDEYCDMLYSGGTCDRSSTSTSGCIRNITYSSWVLIQDESMGDEACDSTDPGSDLMGVRLRDASGSVVAWGRAGDEMLGSRGAQINAYPLTTRLDGSSHGLDSATCPPSDTRLSQLSPPPFSLGCGGWVLIEFIEDFVPVELARGMTLEVLEYGAQCGAHNADAYAVYACSNAINAESGSIVTCKSLIGPTTRGTGTFKLQ